MFVYNLQCILDLCLPKSLRVFVQPAMQSLSLLTKITACLGTNCNAFSIFARHDGQRDGAVKTKPCIASGNE